MSEPSLSEFDKIFQETEQTDEGLVFFIEFTEVTLSPNALPKLKFIYQTYPSEAVKKRAKEAIDYLSPLLDTQET